MIYKKTQGGPYTSLKKCDIMDNIKWKSEHVRVSFSKRQ